MFRNIGIMLLIILVLAGCGPVDGRGPVGPDKTLDNAAEKGVNSSEELPQKLKLAAVGDMMLTRGVGTRIRRTSVHAPFDGVRHIFKTADILFGNLETSIATSGTQLPGKVIWFRAEPEVTEGLKEAGFDVLSLANNHILDYDTPALMETIQNLEGAGIGYVGAGENLEQSRRPLVLIKGGTRVGFLAYNEFYNYFWSYSYRRTFEATEDTAGTAPMKEELIEEDINKLKDLCDVIVVSLHWGVEDSNRVTPEQRKLGRRIIDWGGDIILGHHPHVLQGIEYYKGKPIVYSLGNFIFDQNGDNNNQSIILELELEGGEIVKTAAYPIQIHDKHQPRLPEDAQGDIILDRIESLSKELGTTVHREGQRAVFSGI